MKRSGLKRPTLEQVQAWNRKPRKPIERATATRTTKSPRILRRRPIAKIGAKTRRERADLEAFRAALLARSHGVCEAYLHAPNWRDICGTSRIHAGCDPHHVWPEDRDCGIHDPARGLLLCRRSHEYTEDEPDHAKIAGLLRPDPPEEP